jgi:hypothetical protein
MQDYRSTSHISFAAVVMKLDIPIPLEFCKYKPLSINHASIHYNHDNAHGRIGRSPTTLHYIANQTTSFNLVSTSPMIPLLLAKQLWWVVAGKAIPNHDCKVKITLDNMIPLTTEQQNKPDMAHLLTL